jgi:hypothetical protein
MRESSEHLRIMSAKRFNSRGVMIVLLATSLVGSGCATTSSQAAKPHKPQIITSEGVEEVGATTLPPELDHGFNLSDGWAEFLTAIHPMFEILGGLANR